MHTASLMPHHIRSHLYAPDDVRRVRPCTPDQSPHLQGQTRRSTCRPVSVQAALQGYVLFLSHSYIFPITPSTFHTSMNYIILIMWLENIVYLYGECISVCLYVFIRDDFVIFLGVIYIFLTIHDPRTDFLLFFKLSIDLLTNPFYSF